MSKNNIVAKCLVNQQDILQIVAAELSCIDGRITEIKYVNDTDGSCKGVLIPPFFNMHSHLGECVFFNIEGTDWTISRYLEYTEKYNAGLSKTQRDSVWMESAKQAVDEMSIQGTVGFCAARSAEIAAAYDMLTMSGYPIMNSQKLIDYKNAGIDGFQRYLNQNKLKTNKIGLFLHSVYANDAASFKLAKECIDMGAEFITVHIAEDEETARSERHTHGASAVEILDKYGLLSEKTILVHCGFCSDEDLSVVKKRGATISICPVSNIFLNTKMVDLKLLEMLGIPWCIGSDGLGTGRTFSLPEQVRTAQKAFPDVSWEKYWNSITTVPGMIFKNDLYTGNIEVGVKSTFLRTEYYGNDANELIQGLLEGKIGYKSIKV